MNTDIDIQTNSDKLSRFLVWFSAAILFLTPLFFLPFTASPVGLNKQVFFLFAVIAAFLIFFANVIRHEKLSFKFSAIYVWLAVFLIGTFVSWIFSQARVDGLRIEALSLAFLPVLSYVLFSFLLGVSLRTAKDFKILFFGFIISAVIVSLYAVLRLLSFPQLDFLFPFPFLKSTAFTTLDSFNSLAVFAAAAFLSLASWLNFAKTSLSGKILAVLAFFPLTAVLILVNFRLVWIISAIFVFLLILIKIYLSRQNGASLKVGAVSPLVVLLIVILFFAAGSNIISLNIGGLFGVAVPPEYFPDAKLSYDIAQNVWNKSVPRLFFGNGGGTFRYLYSLYYPSQVNETVFWNVRFNQGYSAAATLAAEGGLSALLALLGIFGTLVFYGAKIGRKVLKQAVSINSGQAAGGQAGEAEGGEKDSGEAGEERAAAIFEVIFFLLSLFLLAFFFVYRANFVLLVSLFASLGALAAASSLGGKERVLNFSFKGSLAHSLAVLVLLVAIPFSALYFFYWEANRYLGALNFVKGTRIFNETRNVDEAAGLLEKAVLKDSWNDDYLRSLALIRIEQIKNILNRAAGAEIDEQTKQVLGALANSAIEAGRAAVEINSADFQNFEALGKAYEGLIPLVNGGELNSLEAYQKAADLNPKGPVHLLNKARVSLISYDNYSRQAQGKSGEELSALVKKQKDALNDAENLLKKSLELKRNYSEAYLALAQVYERQDKTGESISAAELAVLANPEGTGELFQLGYLYYKQSRFSDAKIVFQKLANLYPTYSNGRYFLGLIYDKIGDKKAAVSEFEIVSALNPDNAEVKKILENLRAGRPAFEAAIPENPLEKK